MVSDQAVKEVYDLAKTIDQFGPVVVILSFFILLFLGVMLFFLKNYTKTSEQLAKQQQFMFEYMMKKDNEEKKHQEEEKNIVEVFCKLNTYIKTECEKFQEKTDCDRIGVYVFHNGTCASHGMPFFKISCICEYIKRGCGIQSHIKDSTNIPITVYEDIVERLYFQGGVVVVRNSVEGKFHSDSFFLEKDKAATAIFTVVFDSTNNMMGFILGEYHATLDKCKINADADVYKELCARLKPTLEFSEYQKLNSENKG